MVDLTEDAAALLRLSVALPLINPDSKIDIETQKVQSLESIMQVLIDLRNLSSLEILESWSLIFYVLSGSLPTRDELISLRWGFQQNGTSGATKEYLRIRKQNNSSLKVTFVPIEPNSICIDISHTINYPFNTGIQRVVRHLGAHLVSDPLINWVTWNEDCQTWQLLDRKIVAKKLPFRELGPSDDSSKARKSTLLPTIIGAFWHGLFSSYRYLVSNTGRERALQASLLMRLVKFFRNRHRNNSIRSYRNTDEILTPFLLDQTLLIVEPIQGETLVKRLLNLPPVGKLAVLVYDLLPISNPEFFAASSIRSFPYFLNLLSASQNISCISNFTLDQVRKYVRLDTRAKVESLLLPLGFTDVPRDTSQYRPLPMFLCVGSIEPRKNHLSILKAAENCWMNGLEFELILAGGQGWSNDEVIEFCIELKERGRALKIINDASDPSLFELYSEAFAFITIPWVEGFGLPLAEAISTGKPTIASDITSHREFGCVENVFLVAPDDINGISNTMAQLLEAKKREKFVTVTPRPGLSWENYAHQLIVSIKD